MAEIGELSEYLIDNLVLDFEGGVDLKTINDLLSKDDSAIAQDLRSRIAARGKPDEFLLVLADCLKEHLREGINQETVLSKVKMYVDS